MTVGKPPSLSLLMLTDLFSPVGLAFLQGESGEGPTAPPGEAPPNTVETILKKAFTGFHNSHKFGHDNASPYLGDDLSVRGNGIFAGGLHVAPGHMGGGLRPGFRLSPSFISGTSSHAAERPPEPWVIPRVR